MAKRKPQAVFICNLDDYFGMCSAFNQNGYSCQRFRAKDSQFCWQHEGAEVDA